MAEAVAALSLASNILQVIDGHHSLEGLDEVASLHTINANLSDTLRGIRAPSGGSELISRREQ